MKNHRTIKVSAEGFDRDKWEERAIFFEVTEMAGRAIKKVNFWPGKKLDYSLALIPGGQGLSIEEHLKKAVEDGLTIPPPVAALILRSESSLEGTDLKRILVVHSPIAVQRRVCEGIGVAQSLVFVLGWRAGAGQKLDVEPLNPARMLRSDEGIILLDK